MDIGYDQFRRLTDRGMSAGGVRARMRVRMCDRERKGERESQKEMERTALICLIFDINWWGSYGME